MTNSFLLERNLGYRRERRWSSGFIELLTCGARGPWFQSRSHYLSFRNLVSTDSKIRYDWKIIVRATLNIQN